jgi:hypothetical protein
VIAIDNVLVSDNVVERQFVCDLNKCKGACCEDGDAGAPLDDNELEIILELYEKVKPYLSAASIEEIEKNGKYIYHKEFGWVTPTLDKDAGVCVYGIRASDGIIKCAFEQAYYDGKTNWKKPVSCHLFPIIARKGKTGDHDIMNYEPRERLCNPGCALGKKLRISAYEFLKEALIRKYGEEFYETLDAVGKMRQKKKQAV